MDVGLDCVILINSISHSSPAFKVGSDGEYFCNVISTDIFKNIKRGQRKLKTLIEPQRLYSRNKKSIDQ